MKKRMKLIIAVTLAFAFLFVSCAPADDVGQPADPPAADEGVQEDATTDEVADDETPADVTADDDDDVADVDDDEDDGLFRGEIVVATIGGPGAENAWRTVIEAYNQVQPYVEVHVELRPGDGYGEWLQLEMSSGDIRADIVSGGPQRAVGDWLDFFEYVNRVNPHSGRPWRYDIDIAQQKFISPNGALEIIATDGIKLLLIYNVDKFEELGLSPPSNWEELIEVSELIDEAGYIPIAIAGNEEAFTFGVMSWLLIIYGDQFVRDQINVFRAQPGDFNFDDELDAVWEFDTTDPFNDLPESVTTNVLRVFQALRDDPGAFQNTPGARRMMYNMSRVFPRFAPEGFWGIDGTSANALFLQQRALMRFGATWDVPSLYRDMQDLDAAIEMMLYHNPDAEIDDVDLAPFNFSTVPYPSMIGDYVQAPLRCFEGAAPAWSVVRKDRAHNDMVMDFFMFVTTGPGYSLFLEGLVEGGGTPAGILIIDGAVMPPPYDAIMGDINFGDGSINDYTTFLFRGGNNMGSLPEFAREVYNNARDLFMGAIDADEWGDRHEQNIRDNFDRILEIFQINPDDLDHPERQPTGTE